MRGTKVKLLLCTLGLAMTLTQSAYAAKVVIDPGHGGSDPGAIGINGLNEKKVNLEVSLRLKEELQNKGYDVYLTRETDRYLTLKQRVDLKEQAKGDLFVSIHANAHNSKSIKGTLVLYYDKRYPQPSYPASPEMAALTPESKSLAQYVASALSAGTGTIDRGIVPSSVYMVRNGTMPSVLVELAFLSNPDDAKMLASPDYWNKAARAIASGIESYLPSDFKDIGKHWAKDSIVRLYSQGLVSGSNHRYYPNQALTRAEFLAMVDRIFSGSPVPESEPITEPVPADSVDISNIIYSALPADATVTSSVYATETPEEPEGTQDPEEEGPLLPEKPDLLFSDLSEGHWAYQVIQNGIREGIVKGYPDGTFRPNQAITRAEVTVLLDRLIHGSAEPSPVSDGTGFADVSSEKWYAASVVRMKSVQLVRGVEAGMFAPEKSMSRGEMAVLLDRYLIAKHTVAVNR